MATFVLTDATLVVNSVNLSDHVRSMTLSTSAAVVDDTNMGDTWEVKLGGRKSATLTVEFSQDFAAANVDATLFAALGTVVTWTGKPTSAATSATNPQYSGSVLVSEYQPIDGSHGDLATTSVTWPCSGAVSRATA